MTVEDDDVEVVVRSQFQSGSTVCSGRYRMSLFRKALVEQFAHSLFIFDDQELHRDTAQDVGISYSVIVVENCEYSVKKRSSAKSSAI